MTDTTTTDRVEQLLADRFEDRVYDIHDGTVWVSGMNANCRTVARRMIRDLETHGIACAVVRDDDPNGGVEFDYAEERLPSHHAAGMDPDDGLDEFREFIGETPDHTDGYLDGPELYPEDPYSIDPLPTDEAASRHTTDDSNAVLLTLAAVAIVAFGIGLAVGWVL